MFSLRNVTVGENRRFWPWALEQCWSSLTDCGALRWLLSLFPLSGVDISYVFCVCVYGRLKGLFVFPLVAHLTCFPSNVSETLLSLARRLFFFYRELLNHVNSPSPEFQMQAVEKLAIASAWQVGSISALSPRKAWASSGPLGTTAGCALVRVRLLGH